MTDLDTQTRRRARLDLPDGHRLIDLAFVVALTSLALSGFASSYTGQGFLVVGIIGTLLGVLIATAFRALRWPTVGALLALAVVFFLLGGPLCLRSIGDTAYVPGGGTLGELTDQVLFGWKDMLTTLPPVDGTGPLLVLPWTLGLVSGFVGAVLVHVHTKRSWLTALMPVLACALALVAVIALGVRHPQSLWLQGVGFAALALGWLALRGRRESATVRGGSRGIGRGIAGVALLAVAAVLALPMANAAMGSDSDRTVLRSYVEPPFDIGRYPSLLASFRNYVELPASAREERPTNVYDKELFRVTGAQAGTRVRFATLDRYDGMVWGASNDALPGEAEDSFQRVSSVIDNPVKGEEVKATVTLGEGYRGVWLPVIGALRSMDFESGEPGVKAESFRYNLATSTAVVPSGLHPGDRYSFTAVTPPDTVTADDSPSSSTALPAEGTGFLDGPASKWTEEATTPMQRVFAVAEHLKTEGRYSDGVKKSERTYYPGHGIQRLSDGFVNAEVMVGNDEQYAATMALMANKIGVPARVVMGAVVPEGGVVTGKDVSAWVELRLADGSWRTLPTEEFMSDRPPSEQQPQTQEPLSGTVVPPPAPIPPPSDLGEQADSDLRAKMASKSAEKDEKKAGGLPGWIVTVVTYVGLPLLVIALILGSIIGAKALRRRRRRGAASVSTRFVGAWHELVDHARDLGQQVPLSRTVTRREQSGAIASERAAALAREADSSVWGPAVPAPERAEAYWARIDKERRAMSRRAGRRQRWLAAVNVTTFRPGFLRR
ncbi:transglutaminaseTgpA domain-containing protein [Nocardioides sp. LHG3406-4]|uniref:transglutaminaseTgpA domain-containing protein n=1 Tax=Nocardioides sp. LHG3406-4 TaxID=2804575 RepID=UPI003CF440DE